MIRDDESERRNRLRKMLRASTEQLPKDNEELELLKLAARSIGARPYTDRSWPGLCLSDDPECAPFSVNEDGNAARDWNPLTNDGDALRLAVKLGMRLTLPKYHGFGTTAESQTERTPGHTVFRDDPMQQTREAIVNTAAEIGRAMP